MDQMKEIVIENYDDVNIASVERLMKEEKNDSSREKRAYTMLQNNSPCDVEITQSSREKCANMLLK